MSTDPPVWQACRHRSSSARPLTEAERARLVEWRRREDRKCRLGLGCAAAGLLLGPGLLLIDSDPIRALGVLFVVPGLMLGLPIGLLVARDAQQARRRLTEELADDRVVRFEQRRDDANDEFGLRLHRWDEEEREAQRQDEELSERFVGAGCVVTLLAPIAVVLVVDILAALVGFDALGPALLAGLTAFVSSAYWTGSHIGRRRHIVRHVRTGEAVLAVDEPGQPFEALAPHWRLWTVADEPVPAGQRDWFLPVKAAAPAAAARAAQFLAPQTGPDGSTVHVNQRYLAAAELAELARLARAPLFPTAILILLALGNLFLLSLVVFLLGGAPFEVGLLVPTLLAVLGDLELFRRWRLRRNWRRDVAYGSVLLFRPSEHNRPANAPDAGAELVEVLPHSGWPWTIDGRPAPWR